MKKYKDRAGYLLDKAEKGDSAFTKQRITEQEKIDLKKLNNGVLDTNVIEVSDTELMIMKWYRECFDKPLVHKGHAHSSSKAQIRKKQIQQHKTIYRTGFYNDVAKKYDNKIDYTEDDLIGLSLWFISNSAIPNLTEFRQHVIDPCIAIIMDKQTPEDVKYAPFRMIVARYVCKILQRFYEGAYDSYSEPYSDPLGMFPSPELVYSLLTDRAVKMYPLTYRADKCMHVNWEQNKGFNYITLEGDHVDDRITPPPLQTLNLQKNVILQSIGGGDS